MKTITDIIIELEDEGISVKRQSVWAFIKNKNIPHTAKPRLIILEDSEANKLIEYYKFKKGK